MNLEAAVAFVRRSGGLVEQARLDVALGDDRRVAEAVAALRTAQRGDGAWAPFWAPDASSLDATCYHLAQLEQLGVRRHASTDRGVAFLAGRERPDGAFEEDSALAPLAPPWARPGDGAATLYLTANAGFWLRHYGRGRDLTRARRFILRHLTEAGRLPSFANTHWLAAGLLHALGDRAHAAAIMAHLATVLSELDAGGLAWLVNALRVTGVSPASALVAGACARLDALQAEDGRWPSEDGEWRDANTTVEAVSALHRFAAASGPPPRPRATGA